MTMVGNLNVGTYATAAGVKSSTISTSSTAPKHVIDVRNCSTIDYKITVTGEILGNPPKVEFPGGNVTWTSLPTKVLKLKRTRPEQPLTYKGNATGQEELACTELEEQSVHSSAPTLHSNLGISVTINLL